MESFRLPPSSERAPGPSVEMSRLHGHQPPPPPRQQALRLVDTMPVNGVPTTLIRSQRRGFFTCHVFSNGGTRLALGEVNGAISLWDIGTCEFIAEYPQAFDHSLSALSFVNAGADHLIAVDTQGNVCEFKHTCGPPTEGPSESVQTDRLEKTLIRDSVAADPDSAEHIPLLHQFSEDGRTLACVQHLRMERDEPSSSAAARSEQARTTRVEVICFTDQHSNRIDIDFSDSDFCMPILSKNGRSLLAPIFHDSNGDVRVESPRVGEVWVLPEVNFLATEQIAFKLKGERAVWSASGDMAFVWDFDTDRRPRLSAYETKYLRKSGSLTKPKAELTLRGGLSAWGAQEINSRAGAPHREVVVIQESRRTRSLLIWNLEEDTVAEEVTVPLKPSRPLVEPKRPCPQTSARSNAVLDQRTLSESVFVRRVAEDVKPTFCATHNGNWIGIADCKSLSGSLCCIRTGTTVWDFHADELRITDSVPAFEHAVFDATGRRLLIFAGNKILVFSPPFLSGPRQQQSGTGDCLQDLEIGRNSSEATLLPTDYTCLPSRALTCACEEKASAKQDFLGFPLPTEENSQFVDATLSVDGDLLALVVRKSDGSSFTRTCGSREGASPGSDRFPDLEFPPVLETSGEGFSPRRIFIFRDEQGDEKLVLLSTGRNPLFVWCELEDGKRQKNTLPMNTCLHVSRSNDLETLALLGENQVLILDLQTRAIIKTITYKTNFTEIIEIMEDSMRWPDSDRQGLQSVTDRRISDGGTAVLLAWDAKNVESVVVTPDTERDECHAQIDRADKTLSEFCQLSANGERTLFIDTENFSRGAVTIGFFDQQKKEIAHSIHAESRMPRDLEESEFPRLCTNVCYGLSTDERQLIVQMLTTSRPSGCVLPNRMKSFTVDAIAECVGNYDLSFRREDSVYDYITQTYAEKGFTAFNVPTRLGPTLFHDAVKEGKHDVVTEITQIATNHRGELALHWETDGHWRDILEAAIESNNTNRIEEVVKIVCSKAPPFRNAASAIEDSFKKLVMKHLPIAQEMFKSKLLVFEACRFDVHVGFLNSRPWKETANHLMASDSCIEWYDCSDERSLEEQWRTRNKGEIAEMKEGGDESTTKASLKLVRIANVAKPGMKGIIRPLLLAKVPAHFFDFQIIKWVITYKWLKIWRKKVGRYALKYAGFLVCFALYAIFLASSANFCEESEIRKILLSVLLAAALLFGCEMAMQECRRIRTYVKEGKEYFGSRCKGLLYFIGFRWNAVSVVSHVLMLIVIPIFHCLTVCGVDYDEVLSGLVAIQAIIAFAKVWYFAQTVNWFGAFVRMIDDVVRDCFAFLVLGLDVLFGFSVALYITFRHSSNQDGNSDTRDEIEEAFGSFERSLLTLFYALLGDFEQKIYLDAGNLSWLTSLIFPLYLLAQMVVLLNFLISIMGDTFDRVKSKEEARLLIGRAEFIDWCEAGLSESKSGDLEKSIGKYLHVLEAVKPLYDKYSSNKWSGRLNEIESKFREAFATCEERLTERIFDKLDGILKAVTTQLGSDQERSRIRRDSLEELVLSLGERVRQLEQASADRSAPSESQVPVPVVEPEELQSVSPSSLQA